MPNNSETKTNEAPLVLCEGDVLLKKGPWTAAEDAVLIEYVKKHGEGNWNSVQKNSGLFRCGKSCRLRWANHLRPNLKKGSFCPDEERVIIELHAKFGNKWARMASLLPGRTDNEIKNFWNTRIKRRKRAGLSPYPQDLPKQATHFQFHQPFNSPSPILPIELSSSHQLKPNYGYPLSLFDPITIPTTTPLFTHHNSTLFSPVPPVHEFKHFRGNAPHMPRLQTHGYGLNQSPIPQNPFKPDDGLVSFGPFFSTKLELPSSQMPKPAVNAAAFGNPNDNNILMPLTRDDSKPLDALLQENQVILGCQDSKIEGNFRLNGSIIDAPPYSSFFSESLDTIPLGSASQWDDLNSTHCSVGMKRKKEPEDEFYSMDDELASLLDTIPSNMSIPELGYSDCGETSNGQSSAVTEDDIGLEMQQLISSLPPVSTTTTDHDWSLGAWNNMPGIF